TDLFDGPGDGASARDDDDEGEGGSQPLELSRDRLLERTVRRAHRGRETLMYRVAPGDTVLGIARQFAVDVDDVTRQNHIDGDDKLKVGSLIRLRVRRDMLSDLNAPGGKDDDKAAPSKDRDAKEKDKVAPAHPSSRHD